MASCRSAWRLSALRLQTTSVEGAGGHPLTSLIHNRLWHHQHMQCLQKETWWKVYLPPYIP